MPKIRMRTLSSGPEGTMEIGKTYDVSDEEAKQLVDGRYAMIVEGEKIIPPINENDPLARLKFLPGGYYELPNGDKVRGKAPALEALKVLDDAEKEALRLKSEEEALKAKEEGGGSDGDKNGGGSGN